MAVARCDRCGGLLVSEELLEQWRENGQPPTRGVRCVNCGAVADAVILANRREPAPVKRVKLPKLRSVPTAG